MAQPVDLKISLRRGISGAGETTEAEVAMSLKLGKADSDLGSLVESKFHEVKRALVQALESEESSMSGTGTAHADEKEDLDDWTEAAPAKPATIPEIQPASAVETELDDDQRRETAESRGPDEIMVAAAVDADPPRELNSKVDEIDVPEESKLPITPAQKRTIQSLCASAGIDGRHIQALLESGYNRRSIDELGRREAGSLIFRLSQRQRERMLGDKPEYAPVPPAQIQKEVHLQNGSAIERLA